MEPVSSDDSHILEVREGSDVAIFMGNEETVVLSLFVAEDELFNIRPISAVETVELVRPDVSESCCI